MSVAKQFGENLVRLRKAAGISQEQLAFTADLHRTQISLLERGVRVPRIDTLMKLLAALDASPDELLEGIAWNPGERSPGRFS